VAGKKPIKETAVDDLLRDLIIIQLGIAGVTQKDIRDIVGVDIHRVNRIVKTLRKKGAKGNAQEEA